MMREYVIGLDFGTDSVRAILVDSENGTTMKTSVHYYKRWKLGKYCNPAKSQFRQHVLDHIEGIQNTISAVVKHCDGISLIPAIRNQKLNRSAVLTTYEFEDGPGYSLRSRRFRYIYYPSIGLEELYDHDHDKEEYKNIAYLPRFREIVIQHRRYLSDKVKGISWTDEVDGYSIDENFLIRKTDYKSLK